MKKSEMIIIIFIKKKLSFRYTLHGKLNVSLENCLKNLIYFQSTKQVDLTKIIII